MREVVYNETLVEKKSGLGAGTGEGISGFGFRKWKIASGPGGLEGVLEEQSEMFRRRYGFTFRFQQIRDAVRTLVEKRATPLSTRSGENCRGPVNESAIMN